MKKLVLILDGISIGKTIFTQTLMKSNYWVWNTNHKNYLSMITHKVGWNGERDQNYYEFMEKFDNLVNQYFDSQKQYVAEMIEKLLVSNKAEEEGKLKNILMLGHVEIFHNLNSDVKEFIEKEYSAKSILISDTNNSDSNYNFTLNYKNEDYENQILDLIKNIL